MARVTLRIDIGGKGSIGPGKVKLLELIDDHGSIRSAGNELKMSYARAWTLVQELNGTFGAPVLTAISGGKDGGGAVLTPLGHEIVAAYRSAERKASKAAAKDLAHLTARAAQPSPGGGRGRRPT